MSGPPASAIWPRSFGHPNRGTSSSCPSEGRGQPPIKFDIRQFVGARRMILTQLCSSRSDPAELITMPRHRLPAPRWSMGPMFPIANGVPLRYSPVATWALIAANCVIFLFQLSLSPSELDLFLDRYALIPARYFDAGGFDSAMSATDYLPFVSNMFLHGGWLHLILNMWTLWLFGRAVE